MSMVDTLLGEAKSRGASDLHLVAGLPVMMRLHGELAPLTKQTLTAKQTRAAIYELLDDPLRHQLETLQELDFAHEIPGLARFRVNALWQEHGLSAVFRCIPTEIQSLEELAMPPAVRQLAEARKGLILVTGPTGSGKSTTLAALIDHINATREEHIVTIEDPIEFVHQPKRGLITQREVGTHTPSYAAALRAVGRQDPDVVLVGELRDLETISLAVSCAAFGMLILSTAHTNSAPKTIDRLIDVFPTDEQEQVRTMLSQSLRGIVAQQLLQTKDGLGRCAAVEILLGNKALANIIREGRTAMIDSLMQTGKGTGMQTMDQALLELLERGRITARAALEKAHDKGLFAKLVAEEEGSPPEEYLAAC